MSTLRIPNRFKLFGKTIEVEQTRELSSDRDTVGVCHFKTHRIQLQPNTDGYTIKDDEIALSFLHEVAHFIMYDMEFKLEDGSYAHRNEQFCNLLGLCLHQVLTTMEYDDEISTEV